MFSKLYKDIFIVDSFGTGNWRIGNQPDLRSISVSKKMDQIFQIKNADNLNYPILIFFIKSM